jgi:hypothetical protein
MAWRGLFCPLLPFALYPGPNFPCGIKLLYRLFIFVCSQMRFSQSLVGVLGPFHIVHRMGNGVPRFNEYSDADDREDNREHPGRPVGQQNSKRCDHNSDLVGIGFLLLPCIFFPNLCLGSATYQGAAASAAS